MTRSVIDPLTRIEGHLRVEVEVEAGVVTDAWVSGTLYRGMESVLHGRRPQDAFYISQRICGV
ncbi:MAG: nickel-dependent hydrogenase large subunit, partial [Coriobacteriia bacterium]|nr:nickel-dependent hydrogenase large subunit [Coriobacteriia bacterium]